MPRVDLCRAFSPPEEPVAKISTTHRALWAMTARKRKRLVNGRVRRVRQVLPRPTAGGDKRARRALLAQACGPFLARNLVALLSRNHLCPAVEYNPKRDSDPLLLSGPGARVGLFLLQSFIPGLSLPSPAFSVRSRDYSAMSFFSGWMKVAKPGLASRVRKWQQSHPEYGQDLETFLTYCYTNRTVVSASHRSETFLSGILSSRRTIILLIIKLIVIILRMLFENLYKYQIIIIFLFYVLTISLNFLRPRISVPRIRAPYLPQTTTADQEESSRFR